MKEEKNMKISNENHSHLGTAKKLSRPGSKMSEWRLVVRRMSDGVIVATKNVWLTNNEYVADIAIAKARRLAEEFSE
jgi:hypothetical protein